MLRNVLATPTFHMTATPFLHLQNERGTPAPPSKTFYIRLAASLVHSPSKRTPHPSGISGEPLRHATRCDFSNDRYNCHAHAFP
ncbi:hypothetical protein M407DRAFT_25170 [Tulasnella calospora MUT 4182]|uniref:Uncharacterized protein n=1 Tax=Tulasnella calospora MUT 4182 TaxID=1051891 RepID=A0A0C3Q7B7_9AGAM|nr:hypothetical protein M407DRAFT_25170 [Tulasnella calospora MUT 4182]